MSANGVFLSSTVYELCFTDGSFAPCCSFGAPETERPPRSNAPAPAAPKARNSRLRNQVESGVISEEGILLSRGIGAPFRPVLRPSRAKLRPPRGEIVTPLQAPET